MTEDCRIKITAVFYGSIADIVEKKSLELLLPKDTTVGVFIDTLNAAVGHRLGEFLQGCGLSVLVDGKSLDMRNPERRFLESDEDAAAVTVCMLPMIAGGS